MVLSVDEKTQIQALGRTQKGLPMKPGQPATMTHDYRRHGTTTLFAALDILTGKHVGEFHEADAFLNLTPMLEVPVYEIPARNLSTGRQARNASSPHAKEGLKCWGEVPVYEIPPKIDDTVQVSRDMNLFLAFLISCLLEITKL